MSRHVLIIVTIAVGASIALSRWGIATAMRYGIISHISDRQYIPSAIALSFRFRLRLFLLILHLPLHKRIYKFMPHRLIPLTLEPFLLIQAIQHSSIIGLEWPYLKSLFLRLVNLCYLHTLTVHLQFYTLILFLVIFTTKRTHFLLLFPSDRSLLTFILFLRLLFLFRICTDISFRQFIINLLYYSGPSRSNTRIILRSLLDIRLNLLLQFTNSKSNSLAIHLHLPEFTQGMKHVDRFW